MMKRLMNWLKQNKHVWFGLYVPIYLIAFFVVEGIVTPDSNYWVSYLPMDDMIPFIEYFAIPYWLWYPFLGAVGIYLILRDPPAFVRYMLAIMVSFTLTLIFFLVFPTGQNLRPTAFARDNILTRMMALIYTADTNTNVLPSIHMVGSALAAIAIFDAPSLKGRRFLWVRLGTAALAALISISTVFVKQHSILDIYVGLAVTVPFYFMVYNKPVRAWTDRTFGKSATA